MSSLKVGNKNYSADVMGDAYEYLIKKFADLSKKNAGEYYTPRTIVKLMVMLMDPKPGDTVYDKTTPRLLQSHTLENAVKPPFLGGFFVSSVSVAWPGQLPERKMLRFPTEFCND